MEYPLTMSFKIATVAPQFQVTDAAGKTVFFVKQKAFKLKESVTVFADVEQTPGLRLAGLIVRHCRVLP